jgi:hypothetical protein
LDDADAGVVFGGDAVEGVAARVVFVVGHEDFVARLPGKGAEEDVDALGGVADEHEAVGAGAEKPCEFGPGCVPEGFEFVGEEADGLVFDVVLEGVLALEDGSGAAAEGAMVQEGDVGMEGPEVGGPEPAGEEWV